MISVSLLAATICFTTIDNNHTCYPALVGNKTPVGTFQISHRSTPKAGYGGDILQFHETKTTIYAVHRVWTLKPKEKRIERLKSNSPSKRKITNGCINVDPIVYNELVKCCTNQTIEITK